MKWIKFVKAHAAHKAGEVVSLPEAEAKALVKAGVAEDSDAPLAAPTQKWVKFAKDYDGHKAGESVGLPEAEAKVLVKTGIAEETAEPPDVARRAAEIAAGLKGVVESAVAEGMEAIRKELKAGAASAGGAGSGSKRPQITTHDNADDDPDMGFKHPGEMFQAVHRFAVHRTVDDRLKRMEQREKELERGFVEVKQADGSIVRQKAPTNYASEGIGADGGFLTVPTYNTELTRHALGEESLLSRCRQFVTGGNQFVYPKDETTPWGTNGVQAYWASEASQFTTSKPKIGEGTCTLHKLTVLVPVTNELLEDNAFALGQYIMQLAPERITEKVNAAVVGGTGVGQPLGFTASGALITQDKEGSQTAATVNANNVAKMMSRMPAGGWKNALWLHHSTVFPQLVTMTIGDQPVWTPANGGIKDDPAFGRLLGRPMIPTEQCQVLGTNGDIYFVNLMEYFAVLKAAGLRSEMSVHIYFDLDMSAFRFVFRLGGQPWLQAPITQKNGSGTLSPFVRLQTRS